MRIDFYHLTAAPLERVLPAICEKLLSAGERVLVVTDPAKLGELDRQLWSYASESFLPHAVAGGARDAEQPVLLSGAVEPTNQARNVALADGEWREEALGFERVFYLFDAGTIDNARSNWRALKDRRGTERRYWRQDENGRWIEGP